MSTVTSEKAFLEYEIEEWNIRKRAINVENDGSKAWTQLYKFWHVWNQKLLVKPPHSEPVKTYFTGLPPTRRILANSTIYVE